MAVEDTTFAQALSDSEGMPRHLLLGNGFSIRAHPSFHYSRLADVARAIDPRLAEIFDRAGTTNFEEAMRRVPEHEGAHLREGLIGALHATHPQQKPALRDEMMGRCAGFLAHFLRSPAHPLRAKVFTTNYDLLPYWVIVKYGDALRCSDGFVSNGGRAGVFKQHREPSLIYRAQCSARRQRTLPTSDKSQSRTIATKLGVRPKADVPKVA